MMISYQQTVYAIQAPCYIILLETLNVTQPTYNNHTTNAMSSSSLKIYLSKLLLNNPSPPPIFSPYGMYSCVSYQQYSNGNRHTGYHTNLVRNPIDNSINATL